MKAAPPDLRDDDYRRICREFVSEQRCMAQAGCTRPALWYVEVTFRDTLADVPVTTCRFHRDEMIRRFATCPNCDELGTLRNDGGAHVCAECNHATLSPNVHPIRDDD